ncbi:MAG: LamG domain-containing protein [Planctomycetes bacterium]|nr:LamG domain-containing protein [Planctomycetota bacterium]MBL7146311.1 LamG domain-containing protein [Phycisphaerae bacterium]
MCRKLSYLVLFVLVAGLACASTARAELVGWWRFDEGSGTTAVDSSGNGNDGTFNGDPQWVMGYFGGALEFDGTDDWLDCGSDPSLDLTTWTITFWLKVNENKNYNGFIIKGDDAAENYEILGFADGSFHFPIQHTDGSRTYVNTTTGVIVPDEWAHFAYSYDASQGRRMYKNGSLIFEDTEDGIPQASTTSLAIGNEQPLSRYVNGAMDDIRIYNHLMSEPEIQATMEGGEGYPYALGPVPKDGALLKDTWVSMSWSPGDFAVSHDVYVGDNLDEVNAGAETTFQGNQTDTYYVVGFPGFAFPDGLVPGTTYYWRIDEVNDTEPNSPWKGKIWSFSVPPKTAYNPDPADGAASVDPEGDLRWTAGFGSKLHTVYFGESFDEVDNAAGGLPQGAVTYTPGPLKMAKTYYWRVDEFDVIDTYKGDVWSFTTEGAVENAEPANGAVDVTQRPTLTWAPGFGASHEVYFGADAASPELKGSGNLGSESYDPGQLEWDTTYYWRVDEVNNANADSPWTGPLWSFTTANFLIIDDMESYNNLDEGEPGSNRIYLGWVDGFDNPAINGSTVGNLDPPFAEQTIVHSGLQSMPFAYDNAVGKSEATLTLTTNRDWTVKGVNRLTIWFRGTAGNSAENLYVALNGNAVVNHDNPNAAAQITSWSAWNIDLQAFADQGVNLTNVTSITLGLGNRSNPAAGGAGIMYFDDIRLYPPVP